MDETIIAEIKRRARLFVEDNIKHPIPTDYIVHENAMLIGASIVLESQAENPAE